MSPFEKNYHNSGQVASHHADRDPRRPRVSPVGTWATLISEAAYAAIGDQSNRIELDLPQELDCPLSPRLVASLVRSMVGAAAETTASGSILITVCSQPDTFEIEVADEGPSLQFRPQRIPMAAASAGAEFVWQDCPQGGVAVTAVITRKSQRRLAA